jgi:hypothetical protein
MMDHDGLIARALTWLRSQQHPLVLSEMASCSEVPDAIGFATNRCTVVEVKTSRSDFRRDQAKYKYLVNENGQRCSLKAPLIYRKHFEGCKIETAPSMGSQRYFMSVPDIITPEMVQQHHPDHGLLYVKGKIVKKILEAPMRVHPQRDFEAEARYLQYSMRHLVGNLAIAGVKVNLVKATKMFNETAIDIVDWKKRQSEYQEEGAIANG